MKIKRLLVNATQAPLTVDDFAWHQSARGPRSFQVSVGPYLSELGTVPSPNVDLVWLAATAFLADRTYKRGKGWERQLQIIIPSTNPDAWNAVSADIEEMLSVLTSDEWMTTFVPQVPEPIKSAEAQSTPEVVTNLVCLFSGGADSVCAAVKALSEGHNITLLSHWDYSMHSKIQSQLVNGLRHLFSVNIPHQRVNLAKSKRQIGGVRFPDEESRRSRSLLFISLGLALASARNMSPLWIGENGFISLNPPLGPERLGALSTRTTHQDFLGRLHRILQSVGVHNDFRTPFSNMSKGEMFAAVSDTIGPEDASVLLSNSDSCAHPRLSMKYDRSPGIQCGACLGCLVRRGAFIAADLEDRTTYLIKILKPEELKSFLIAKEGAEIDAIRHAVGREFSMVDVLNLELTPGYDPHQALDLVRRGFRELAAVELP